MNYIERIKELLSALGYTIAACSQEQDLVSFLFFRADHISGHANAANRLSQK